MPANPKECRLRAATCVELAKKMKHENLKRSLIGIATNWVKLAEELEGSAIGDRTTERRQSATPLFR